MCQHSSYFSDLPNQTKRTSIRISAALFSMIVLALTGNVLAQDTTGENAPNTTRSVADTNNGPSTSNSGIDLSNPAVEEAVDFTRDLTNRANQAFTQAVDETEQLESFRLVLSEGLALDYLGRFMLGSTRNDLTDTQKERYGKIFPQYITRLYANQFKDIAGRELTINEATPFGRRDVIVRTQFFREDGSPVNVDWRARPLREGGHKMIDIIVSGVSIMTVKRDEFSSFISANGIDALIDRLEQEAQA